MLSTALAAPWTRPCSSPLPTRLTRLDIVGWPKPIPNANGTRLIASAVTEWAAAADTSPTAAQTSPILNVGWSPSRRTIGRINPP